VELGSELPPVLGNEAALTQCFSNLLDNAIKFVSPGTFPEVRVSGECRGEWVRIWVDDNGIGIAKDHQERIFGLFERLDPAQGGTGIGLALVQKVVRRMGGKVGVDSDLGRGSRFWLELRSCGLGESS
jgi:signal transduction histidine kinase